MAVSHADVSAPTTQAISICFISLLLFTFVGLYLVFCTSGLCWGW